MPFTYDISTDIGKVRFLAQDTTNPPVFDDTEVQAMLDLFGGSIYLAAAQLLDRRAVVEAATSSSVTIGDYSESRGNKSKNYADAAQRLRDMENYLPAFAVAEENLSSFSELEIIRNWVFRNGSF